MTIKLDEHAEARPLWGWIVAAAVIAAFSIVLVWVVEALPIICPAIYPAPPSCAPGERLGPALVSSASLVALFMALSATGAVIRIGRRDKALRTRLIVLVLVAVVVPLWTLSVAGFRLS